MKPEDWDKNLNKAWENQAEKNRQPVPPPKPPPPSRRLFARVWAGDLCCPWCGKYVQFSGKHRPTGHWDPLKAKLTCTNRVCQRTYIVGLNLWSADSGRSAVPWDQTPTPQEVQAIEETLDASRFHLRTKGYRPKETNKHRDHRPKEEPPP